MNYTITLKQAKEEPYVFSDYLAHGGVFLEVADGFFRDM